VTNSRRIEGCGRIRLELRLEEGRIRDLRITGDFFGNRDVEELAGILEGCAFRREAVLERLSGAKLEEYIHNVTVEDLIGLLMA
jgi:lipoate-protein ligase A